MFSSCCKRIDGQQRTLFRPISCWYVSFSNVRVNEMKEGGGWGEILPTAFEHFEA